MDIIDDAEGLLMLIVAFFKALTTKIGRIIIFYICAIGIAIYPIYLLANPKASIVYDENAIANLLTSDYNKIKPEKAGELYQYDYYRISVIFLVNSKNEVVYQDYKTGIYKPSFTITNNVDSTISKIRKWYGDYAFSNNVEYEQAYNNNTTHEVNEENLKMMQKSCSDKCATSIRLEYASNYSYFNIVPFVSWMVAFGIDIFLVILIPVIEIFKCGKEKRMLRKRKIEKERMDSKSTDFEGYY